MRLPFTMTTTTVSVVIDNRPKLLRTGSPNFEKVRELLQAKGDHDVNTLRDLLDIPSFITKETFGRVKVGVAADGQWGVIFDGVIVKNVIADRLVDAAMQGYDIENVARFLDRLMDNPLESARNELFLWLENGNYPFLSDGRFLAYKRVRGDYTDIRTGKFDNSVGKIVFMPREQVDPNRFNECSTGLHFCAVGYLANFGDNNAGTDRVVIVAIDPADVVAIPKDYNNQKGRTWRYEVVGEVPNDEVLTYNIGIVATQVEESLQNSTQANDDDASDNLVQAESDPEDLTPEQILAVTLYERCGFSSIRSFMDEVEKHGQRPVAARFGIPRSTLQGWVVRARNLGY